MKVDYGYFKNYSHLDVIKVFNSVEWHYILVVDVLKKNGLKKRKLFNLSSNGDEVNPEWYCHLKANSFKLIKNLTDEIVKEENI